MKIKVIKKPYEEVIRLKNDFGFKPRRPSFLLRTLVYLLSQRELRDVRFKCDASALDKLKRGEPFLALMNHSSFIDLKIASKLLYPRPFCIVCTTDGFIGKKRLMQNLGCIPAIKFVADTRLVRNLVYAVRRLRAPILMYPEASYSFDGCATPLPDSLGKCVKLLGVPVVMIRTYGAFLHDPLYNGLRLRDCDVSAKVEYLLSASKVKSRSADEINSLVKSRFTFDNFRLQTENGIKITEPFRAEGLNRVLYKCPNCETEGKMNARGAKLSCTACGSVYELTEDGRMEAKNGGKCISHIPDWYAWERECVKRELEAGKYRLDIPVNIKIAADTRAVYDVGDGRLVHTKEGFHLTGSDGKLDYKQSPAASYSLYSDYFWYELGDMVCIGDARMQYYCFPKLPCDIAAKTRLAAELLYRAHPVVAAADIGGRIDDKPH